MQKHDGDGRTDAHSVDADEIATEQTIIPIMRNAPALNGCAKNSFLCARFYAVEDDCTLFTGAKCARSGVDGYRSCLWGWPKE